MATNLVIVVGILLFFALIFWSISQAGTTSATPSREFAPGWTRPPGFIERRSKVPTQCTPRRWPCPPRCTRGSTRPSRCNAPWWVFSKKWWRLQRQANQHLGRIAGGSND